MATLMTNNTGIVDTINTSVSYTSNSLNGSFNHPSRLTDEEVLYTILKVNASKEEIIKALREVFPEKFI